MIWRLRWFWFGVRRAWRRLRYSEYSNSAHVVSPLVNPTGDDTKNIQDAIDSVAGTNTPDHLIFLIRQREYNAKWYRFFIRKPVWVSGGTVFLSPGEFNVGSEIKFGNNVHLEGASRNKTRLRMER